MILLESPQQIILTVGALLFVSIAVSKLSERSGVPTLLLFLGIGMLAGSDGLGGIHFDDVDAANLVGTFALAYILFSGGMGINWASVRPVLGRSAVLATAGVAVTAFLLGAFAHLALGVSLLEGLLIGSIVSSTDAAAVFAVLRSRGVGLKGGLKPLLEMESGSNDPMAVFMTIALIRLLMEPGAAWTDLIPSFLVNMSLGAAAGLAMGRGAAWVLNRIRLDYEGLYPVLSMSVVLITYGLSEMAGGNGFLAVYVCGLVLGNSDFSHKRLVEKFHDGLGWLMQICMFLLLGLLVFPSRLEPVMGGAMAVAVFLMFVARPLAVHLVMLGSSFSLRERTLIAWTGLRGAVPIVLATFPLTAGYEHADAIFHMIFFVVLASVLLQGTTLMPFARLLKVDEPLSARPRYPLEFEKTEAMGGDTREIEIQPGTFAVGKLISELGFPPEALILLVRRGNSFLIPRGRTRIEPYDTLLIIAGPSDLKAVREILDAPAWAGADAKE